MKLTATQIAAACDGQFVVRAEDEAVCAYRLCWDSREVLPGDLYVALPGERVDGHDFVARAIEAGAVAALVMRPTDAETLALARTAGVAIIQVADTKQAIDDLACAWRAHLDCPIIGVTGSSGKTTTKNLIRDVLSTSMRVVATQGNQNNELGAPRTLLSADEDTEALVVEMGMHSAGEISHLCDIIRPDWGVIVSVGESHIEYLGSRENIARAKAELFCALAAGGHAFVNAADDFAEFVCDEAQLAARGVAVSAVDGTGEACVEEGWSKCASAPDGSVRAWATDVELNEDGCPRFSLHIAKNGEDGEEALPCVLGLRGLHNVGNACLAAAVGVVAGVPSARIVSALEAAQPESGRQEILRAKNGCLIVNDAYNANPDSMRTSLLSFSAMATKGKRVAVLGDMGELGDFAIPAHKRIGALLATLPIDLTICVGELATHIAEAAIHAGANRDSLLILTSVDDVLRELAIQLAPEDSVLIKASHFMGLSRVVEGLQK